MIKVVFPNKESKIVQLKNLSNESIFEKFSKSLEAADSKEIEFYRDINSLIVVICNEEYIVLKFTKTKMIPIGEFEKESHLRNFLKGLRP